MHVALLAGLRHPGRLTLWAIGRDSFVHAPSEQLLPAVVIERVSKELRLHTFHAVPPSSKRPQGVRLNTWSLSGPASGASSVSAQKHHGRHRVTNTTTRHVEHLQMKRQALVRFCASGACNIMFDLSTGNLLVLLVHCRQRNVCPMPEHIPLECSCSRLNYFAIPNLCLICIKLVHIAFGNCC